MASTGTWNSAHFANKAYDTLASSYIAALDLEAQKTTASQIQRLLLDETPLIFSYFYDFLTVTQTALNGVEPTAMGHLFLSQASL